MATIKPTRFDLGDGAWQVTWTPCTNADTCAAVRMPGYSARSIQAEGTFGSATVVLNGSIDQSNFRGLTKTGTTAISITTAAINLVQEAVSDYQPAFSGGDGTQSLTITMMFQHAPVQRT